MAFEVNNLSFSFNNDFHIENLSFKIAQNEVCLLKGASGSGKSTLLNIISGLKKPDNGNIILNNNVLNSENEFINPEKRNIGYVFQDFALFPHINSERNMKYAISKDFNDLYDEIVSTLRLNNHINKMPHELSGGQKQRVALARAILMKPSLLLLDEPFSNLDSKNIISSQKLIIEIIQKLNIPCVLVTHDINQLEILKISKTINLN